MNEGCVPEGLVSANSSLEHFDEGLLLGLGPIRVTGPVPANALGYGF